MKKNSQFTPQQAKDKFLKKILRYAFILILISVIYLKSYLPGFVYFIIVLSLTYGLAKKYIDYRPVIKKESSENKYLYKTRDLLQTETWHSKKSVILEK